MLRNGAPLGHLSHQRKWGSREKRSHNFWPFSPHGRLPLINQTEGPQLGKERGLSWPYLSLGHPLDKTGLNRWTSNTNRRRYAIAHRKAIRQYGHKIWFDQPAHAHGVPSLPMRKTPTGLQHGTSCMIRSLRSFQFRMEVEDIWEQNTLKYKIHEQRLREIMWHTNCETVTELR